MTAPPSPLPIPCNAGSGEEPQRVRELAALFAVSAAINQSITETDALDAALRQVLQVLCLDSGRIYLFDEATGEYSLAARAGDPTLLDPSKTEMVPGECLCGFVGYAAAPGGEEIITLNPQVAAEGCHRHSGLSACAAVPLLARERMLGVLHVGAQTHEALGEPEMALLRSVGTQIGFALENMRLREEAQASRCVGRSRAGDASPHQEQSANGGRPAEPRDVGESKSGGAQEPARQRGPHQEHRSGPRAALARTASPYRHHRPRAAGVRHLLAPLRSARPQRSRQRSPGRPSISPRSRRPRWR